MRTSRAAGTRPEARPRAARPVLGQHPRFQCRRFGWGSGGAEQPRAQGECLIARLRGPRAGVVEEAAGYSEWK
ncbi:MAG TPA: hypothetical protein VGV06_20455 [Methylomirabilota bacterium]|nr:hypothetical protein [Methylomirabilota bacterium]